MFSDALQSRMMERQYLWPAAVEDKGTVAPSSAVTMNVAKATENLESSRNIAKKKKIK